MALELVSVDGQRTSAGAAHALAQLKAAFRKAWKLDLILSSGYRTYEQQKSTFLNAYRVEPRLWVKGPFGDVRWWRGKRYVRVGGEGTVAQPGTSRHEKASAVDLRDSGLTPGVSSRTPNLRRTWLRANAPRFGFEPTGYGFDEPWHYDYTGSHEAPASGGTVTPVPAPTPAPTLDLLKEDNVKFLYVDNNGSGKPFWVLLNTVTGKIVVTYEQLRANGWALVWGPAQTTKDGKPIPRQEFLNAIDAIEKTK